MAMDNDLLDVHLHAEDIGPAGVRALAGAMQRQRDAMRETLNGILERCAEAKSDTPNIEALEQRLDEIDYFLAELDFRLEISEAVDWRELARHG